MAQRILQRFSIAGGLNEMMADSDTNPLEFILLKNCYPDRKVGAIVGRNGSLTETIVGTPGVPLGTGQYLANASSLLLPITRSLIQNFGGSNFQRFSGGAWANIVVDSNTNFSSGKVSVFAQIADVLGIFSGRPARLDGATNDIERMGIPPPTAAPTLADGGVGNVLGTNSYYYTFYNSASGLESDASPTASITVTNRQVDLSALETTTAASGVDQKRIYRAVGGVYRLVGTTTLAATTFSDNVAAIDLGIEDDPITTRALPPENVFVAEAFHSHFFGVDASDPSVLRYTKPYIGNSIELEYWPSTSFIVAEEPITALKRVENRLLVFHPRNISFVTGFSAGDFQIAPFFQGVGTLFPHSVATNGELVVFLAEEGFVALGPKGKRVIRQIDRTLRQIINNEYNAALHVATSWNPALRQFLFLISAISTAGSPWEVVGDGAFAEWVDSITGGTEDWEDSAAPGTEETVRVKLWGWVPDTGQWVEYEYDQIQDLNADGAYATHLFTPLPSSETLDPSQDKTYMGVYDGTNGTVLSTHRRDRAQDDSTDVTAQWLTGRIVPGEQNNGIKRVHSVQFNTAFSDPTDIGTLQYLEDLEDPLTQGFTGALKNFTVRGEIKVPEDGKCRFMHLYGTATLSATDQLLLSDFGVYYRERFSRQER